MDKASKRLVKWLRKRPQGAQIRWCSLHYQPGVAWAHLWVDVSVFGYRPDEVASWVFTVESPKRRRDSGVDWSFRFAYDLDVHGVAPADTRDRDLVYEVILPHGQALNVEQDTRLEAALAENPGGRRGVIGAWTPGRVTQALNWWTATYARRPDLQFFWDPDADLAAVYPKLYQILEAADQFEMYTIGPGMNVSGQVMDILLQVGSDEAAKLTEAMNNLMDAQRSYDPFIDE